MKQLNVLLQKQFDKMQQTGKLFRAAVTGSELWDTYLNSFSNPAIFRDPNSNTYKCNHCNNFVRRYGNIVCIIDNKIVSLFDFEIKGEYKDAVTNLRNKVKESVIKDVFFETFTELNSLPYGSIKKSDTKFPLGVSVNHKKYNQEEADKYGHVSTSEVYTFNHMSMSLNKEYLDMSGKSVESIMGDYRASYDVFERGLREISLDTLELVRDLINQGSLLDGTTHLYKVNQFIEFKKSYEKASNKSLFCWENSYKLPTAKFRNELIGTLCVELSEGVELNEACKTWNKRVDPSNYMKALAPFTEKQRKEAEKTIEELGYEESFNRRCAIIDDIDVSQILHSNIGDGKITKLSVLSGLKATSTRHKRAEFDGVETVNIDKFMKDILPTCSSIEVYLENRLESNLVTLTTADKNSKSMFKYGNNFSRTFKGNLAGKSQLAERVTAKGGRVDGVFRFTHSWNELEPNQSLMDLHVFLPTHNGHEDGNHDNYGNKERVGWNNRNHYATKGVQDVDYTSEAPVGYIPVENITFPDIKLLPEGKYVCKIHNWNFRGTGGKGRAEIAIGNEVYEYIYPATKYKQWVTIAEVTLKDGQFTINHVLEPVQGINKEIYGLETNQFHKVNLVCLSPNHWNEPIGNKYYMFMIEGCKADGPIRSFHSEDLVPELAAHRKVLEPFGAVTMIESTDKQLSGVGFNATVKDEVVLKLSGSHKRVIKVQF